VVAPRAFEVRSPPQQVGFDVVMNADGRDIAGEAEIAREIETVNMNEVERGRAQTLPHPRTEGTRFVQVCGVDAGTSDAAQMIPDKPGAAMLLRNRKNFQTRELPERLLCRGTIAGRSGTACAFETQGGDVERACQQPQDVVCPNPYASIRRIRERLTEKQQPRTMHRRLVVADQCVVRGRVSAIGPIGALLITS